MLRILAYGRHLLERLYESGRRYMKVGVVLDGLELPGRGQQLDLFAPAAASPPATHDRHQPLMA